MIEVTGSNPVGGTKLLLYHCINRYLAYDYISNIDFRKAFMTDEIINIEEVSFFAYSQAECIKNTLKECWFDLSSVMKCDAYKRPFLNFLINSDTGSLGQRKLALSSQVDYFCALVSLAYKKKGKISDASQKELNSELDSSWSIDSFIETCHNRVEELQFLIEDAPNLRIEDKKIKKRSNKIY